MNTRTRNFLTNLGIAALPVVAVLAFGLLLPVRGPAKAKAATVPESEPRAIKAKPALDQALFALVNAEMSQPFAGSPMLAVAGPSLAEPEFHVDESEPVAQVHAIRTPDLSVSAIMNARGNTVAVINSKIRHAGDDLGDGWSVESINPADSNVVIRHTSGATATLTYTRRTR